MYGICTLSAVSCISKGEARENTLKCTKGTTHTLAEAHGTENDHWKCTEYGSKNFRGGLADLRRENKVVRQFVPVLETIAM